MATNRTFTDTAIRKDGSSSFNIGRPELLDKKVAEEFNTYRNWGEFSILAEPVTSEKGDEPYVHKGVKALFNNVNAVGSDLKYQLSNNAPLLDAPSMRDQIRSWGDCSVKALVQASEEGKMGRAIYNYSDFMYCKHLGKVSNNYLVTLRRFPTPCGDHINFTDPTNANERKMQQHMPDVGRLVTWIGTPGNDMSNILKYSVKMPYKELTAEMQDTTSNIGENGGMLGNFLNLANPKYNQMVVKGQAGAPVLGVMQNFMNSAGGKVMDLTKLNKTKAGDILGSVGGKLTKGFTEYDSSTYHNWYDRTKADGPVNVISKTHTRQGGAEGGLEFNQDITLVFDYELRSYDGINGKAAFLDLIANILAVTYTNGKFWGGGFRAAGPSQSNVFANLPIYKLGDKMPLSFSTVTDSLFDSLQQIGNSFAKQNGKTDDITTVKGALNALANLGKGLLNTFIGGAINSLGRPQKQALNSLLNPAPVGLWHLTIGNPKHPIMTMGNMILDDVQIEHYGSLGLDDFPTGLRVEVKLKHAKPRDAMQIEQMYLMGDFRTYYPMSGVVSEMYKCSSRYKDNSNIEDTANKDGADGASKAASETNWDNVKDSIASKEANDIYLKFFGTKDATLIMQASAEAAWGAHKKPPTSPSNNQANSNK